MQGFALGLYSSSVDCAAPVSRTVALQGKTAMSVHSDGGRVLHDRTNACAAPVRQSRALSHPSTGLQSDGHAFATQVKAQAASSNAATFANSKSDSDWMKENQKTAPGAFGDSSHGAATDYRACRSAAGPSDESQVLQQRDVLVISNEQHENISAQPEVVQPVGADTGRQDEACMHETQDSPGTSLQPAQCAQSSLTATRQKHESFGVLSVAQLHEQPDRSQSTFEQGWDLAGPTCTMVETDTKMNNASHRTYSAKVMTTRPTTPASPDL